MQLDNQDWGEHPLFPGYKVFRDGRVFGRWNYLVGDRTKAGYLRYRMTDRDGRSRKYMASRLVLETFDSEPPFEGAEAAHLDGNNQNDSLHNLAWKTRPENMLDKLRHGTERLGERCNLGKLTDEQSDRVYAMWETGIYTLREIGDEFDITAQAVWYIKDSRLRRAKRLAGA